MTNVKLKLMFFLLNALLTADIVHARPYSDNTTDVYINNNDTVVLPVEPNSDTLIVATDNEGHADQTVEETNRNSHTDMEEIVNAEQDRDEALSKKNMKEKDTVLEIKKDEAPGFEKQLNISSSLMEDIIDSETDRDESLTDILFRPASEFVEDMPRFEFLISTKLNESDVYNRSVKDGLSDNSLDGRNRSRKFDYAELVEVLRAKGDNKSAYFTNITGHEVDNDLAPDTSFTDMQTLVLAGFATLVPLLLVLFATLFIRCLCRRYCKKISDSSDSESSDNKDTNSHQQLKSPDDTRDGVPVDTPANGSIITMTLKNNHLIVETEERNDITKNGRETKMKYSPDNDGIFVVEVQQSTAYRRNNKVLQNSPPHDPQISTNQALIHRVPEELEQKLIEEDNISEKLRDKILALSSTGLSISDLSMSSIGSHNASYSYGSQIGYEQGPFGYPLYAGYDIPKEDIGDGIIHDSSREPLITKTPTDPDKPVVTAAIFKQDSIIGNDALQGPGYCIEGSTDGPLLSDVQAREVSLQHLHDEMEKKLENGVAVIIPEKIESPPKKTFNRADSLPVRLEEDNVPDVIEKNVVMETINEDDAPSKDALKGKRASLPIIRTEIYESVKDAIRPTGSPKFEKFSNDNSPGDADLLPPMITITEEESGKSENAVTIVSIMATGDVALSSRTVPISESKVDYLQSPL